MNKLLALMCLFCIPLFGQNEEFNPAETSEVRAPTAPPVSFGGSANVLYDNGSLVNSPGTGSGGADESVLQSVGLGLNTIGFGHQVLNDNWVADDFTVPATGWSINTIDFFAYQTGSTTTSTITGVNVTIWDGPPPSANVVATSSNMTSTGWTGIYRVTETTSGTTNRPIMVNTVDFGTLNLAPGTYWISWQTDGSLASGPWAPPISINGTAVTGNGLQSTDAGATFPPALDSGTGTPQQGFPFIIYGALPIPTMGEYAMIAFLCLLTISALVMMRRTRKA